MSADGRANTLHVVPYPWTDDDLLFALVRAAHLEPPQRIADDLLSAADRPDEGRHLLMTGCCGGPPPGTTGLPRQAPDLTGILGGTWRDLTARVESFMSTAAQSASAPYRFSSRTLISRSSPPTWSKPELTRV